MPERYTDPFGNVTTLTYDPLDLFVASSTDALGNTTRVIRFDFRVLAPRELQDPNDNRAEVYFDVLGLPTAMAVKGKGDEGDNLTGFGDILANPDLTALTSFSTAPVYDEAQARQWLGNATARHIYHFGEVRKADGSITWGTQPACACGILRERHVSRLAAGERSPLQAAFEYFDGMGSVLVKKVQAEPVEEGGPLRWIASGKTILNNKGKPVKQYEPYFSESGHRFEEPRENGVTPVLYYDAAGRTIRTEAPDGSHSRVEFSPWHVATYDQNDTVLEPGNAWYARKSAATASAQDQRAARLAAEHAGTPALTLLDSLGRDVVAIAYNRIQDDAGTLQPEKYLTFTKLDAEGKPLWIRDARGNLVMQYITPSVPNNQAADPVGGFAPCYDIVGNLLFQHSMDAGDCWMFNDAAGKPMLAWDFNERQDDMGTTISEQRVFFTRYDRLHRPTEIWLTVNAALPQLIERFVYGEALSHSDEEIAEAKRLNLRGQLHEHYDMSGLVTHLRHDFKGNLLEAQRTLASTYQAPVIDWSAGSPTNGLESETFTQLTEYDALNRTTRQYNWHKVMPDSRVAVYEPRYNARGLLVGEDLVIRATKKPNGYEGGQRTTAIVAIAYDAKGQKERIEYGNRTTTRYHYDPETFRLQQLRTTRPGYNPRFPEHRSGLSDDRVLQQLSYTYDPVGNITEIYDEAYEPVFFANQRVEPQSRYTYDALYRLLEATGRENATAVGSPPHMQNTADHIGEFPIPGPGALRNYTQRYQYDAVGNIERMQHLGVPTGSWTRLYTYADDSNRLLRTWAGADRWEDTTATNKVTYGYDTHGSMLNLTDTGEEFRLSWDYRDMIHTVNLGGGGRAYYNYDVGKDRTRKVIIGETGNNRWERLYLSGVEVYRRFVAGEMTEEIETHHLFVGEQRALIVEDVLATNNTDLGRGPRFRYQYNNHLGSACMELDDAAAVITYEEYHPYGTTAYFAGRSAAEVSLKRYRYTGKERDGETGLHYHSARYYTPWLGRWTSCDPAQYIDGPNLYLYCNNNPVRYFDPNGRDPIPIIVPGSPSGPPLGGGGAITLPGTQPGTYEWRQPPRPSPPQGLRIGAGVAGVAGAATLIVAVAVAGAVLLFTGLGGNRYSDREMIRRHFAEEQRHPISVPPPHPTSIAVDPRQQQPAQAPPQAPPARVEDPTIHPPVVDPRPVVPHLATTSLPDRARRAVQLLYGPASADAQAWLARMEQRSGRGGSAAIGPVLSMVRDPRAPRGNSIFIGLNTGLPPDLHPILAQRLRGVLERRARGEVTVRNTNAPGSHAEFNAFNQAIHAREARERRTITEADLSEFEMHNVWLQPQQRLQAAPRCDVCGPVTQDISITPELAEAERALAAQLAAGLGRQR
ncbi:MAG: RHS repeat-associated core domain-containing protein [Bryobacteraceae bacterium]